MIATGKGRSRRHAARAANVHDADSAATRYEVLERAGEGTLCVVYRVRHRESAGIRALKAFKGVYSRHAEFAPAILELAAHTQTLRHAHLCSPIEAGREEGTVFVVEDWMPGGSLDSRLRRAPLGAIETALLASQLAEALEYLHDNDTVHGDVRARQILFDAEGAPRLNDIGLSQAFAVSGMALSDVQLDAVLYTAPERFDGAPASEQGDLYSLGVVLYRAITGRVPFDGPSPLSIAMRHRNDTPLRPAQWNPDCPPELEAAILKLLAKEPEARYASAGELLDEIAPHHPRRSESNRSQSNGPAPAPLAAIDLYAVPPAEIEPTDNDTDELDEEASTAPNDTLVRARPVRETRPRLAPSTPARVEEEDEEEDFLSEEEKQRRARLAKRQRARREMWGAFLAFFWLIVFGGLLYGMCYGAYYFWMKEAPPEVQVPKYVGLNQRNAEVVLTNAGLKLRVGKEVYNPKKPEGTILGGDPPAGKKVRKGRDILVTVSRGEEPIPMYDFSDLSLDQARNIITRHGLRLGQISEQFHTVVPKGYVCGQYPEPGETFRRYDPINLVISRGPQPPAVAPAPEELPVAPEAAPETARVKDDDVSVRAVRPPSTTQSEDVLVPRAAVVSVALPSGGGPQEVRIAVRDATGDFTAYQQTHEAGDVVDKTIQVVRPQGGTALVRVYVGGKLLYETRI